MKERIKQSRNFGSLLIAVAILGGLLALAEWFVIHHLFLKWLAHFDSRDQLHFADYIPLQEKLQMAAHVGEMFVAVHALIELCILIFGLYTFVHERHQLRESLFQTAFFSHLALFNAYVVNLREGPLRGAQCLEEWRSRMTGDDQACREFYWQSMSSYFLQVNSLLQMIEHSEIPPSVKRRYAQILEASFSNLDNDVQGCLSGMRLQPAVSLGHNIQALRRKWAPINSTATAAS
ncbi:MAG TPA: hypothetical protein VGO67_01090 [Verrucomicrobiae bacterium]|jgi:hypothetical protein